MAGPVPCTLHDAYMIRKTAVLSTKKTPRVLETLAVFAPLSGGGVGGWGMGGAVGRQPTAGEGWEKIIELRASAEWPISLPVDYGPVIRGQEEMEDETHRTSRKPKPLPRWLGW